LVPWIVAKIQDVATQVVMVVVEAVQVEGMVDGAAAVDAVAVVAGVKRDNPNFIR
jgi:hypothetical protein